MPNYNFTIQATATLSPVSLKNIQTQLNTIAKSAGIKIDATPIKQTGIALKDATKQSNIFGQSLGSVSKKIISWTLLTGVIFGVIHALKNGIQAVVDLDSALVELRKVTNLTADGLKQVVVQASAIGDEVARTTIDVIKATSAFARMGYSVRDSLNLAKQAEVLVNIGDGIDNVDTSTAAIISTLKGFSMAADQTSKILDILNEVSNNYAVNTSDLADGITRVSATLGMAGNSLEQTVAMITAATEVLRDSSRASIGLRTIALRLRGVSEEGEDLSDLVPKLKDEFDDIGITLLDSNNNFRSTYDILRDLSGVWGSLTDLQKANLTMLIAGTRQSDVLNSVLINSKTLINANTTALNSEGSAMKENAIYMDSIAAKTELFSKAAQDMWINAINSQTIKDVIDFGTGLLKVVDSLGLVNVAITALTTISIVKLIPTLKILSGTFKGMFSSVGDFKAGMSLIGESLKGFGITAGIALVTLGITELIKYYKKLDETYDNLLKTSSKVAESYQKSGSNINVLVEKLKNTTVGSEEYFQVTSELNDIMPDFIQYVNSSGEAFAYSYEYLQDYIDLLNQFKKAGVDYSTFSVDEFKDNLKSLETELLSVQDALGTIFYDPRLGDSSVKAIDLIGLSIDELKEKITTEFLTLHPQLTGTEEWFTDWLDEFIIAQKQFELNYTNYIRNTQESIAKGVSQYVDLPESLSESATSAIMKSITSIVSDSIKNIDVLTEEGIEEAKKKAIAKAKELEADFGSIDFSNLWNKSVDIFSGFDTSIDFNASPQSTQMLTEQIRTMGAEFKLTDDQVKIIVNSLISLKNQENQVAQSTVDIIKSLSELTKETNEIIDSVDVLNSALKEQRDTHDLSSETIMELIDAGYASAIAFDEETGKAYLNKDAMIALAKSKIDVQIADLLLKKNNLQSKLVADGNAAIDSAKGFVILAGAKALANDATYMELEAVKAEITALEKLKLNIGKIKSSSGGGGGSGSAKKESDYLKGLKALLDARNDALDMEIDKQKDLLDALKEQYEVEDMITKLQQTQLELANAQDEKNVRLYNPETGKFEWVADPRAVRAAQEAYDDAKQDYDRYNAEKAIEDQIDALQGQRDAISSIIDAINNVIQRGIGKQITSWDQLIAKLNELGIAYQDISGAVDVSGATPVVTSNAIASGINVILAKGDRGANVKTLQRALNALGFRQGTIDGIFGSNTKASLQKFQSAMGLSASGVLDDATKAQFKIKGYKDGGGVYQTAPAILHGSSLNPEYVHSAPAVESMMGSLPDILANLATDDKGDIYINIDKLMPYGFDNFIRDMKSQAALDPRVQRR
jgi:TP901 family phage tail tape measure protein